MRIPIVLERILSTEGGMTCWRRRCAASRTMVSLAEPGETERNVSGSTADLELKDRGDNSMLLTR